MKVLTLALLFSIFTSSAYAGNETGHGGNGVLCVNPSTGEKHVELLDLWNGEAHGLRISRNNNLPAGQQLEAALAKLRKIHADPDEGDSLVEVIRRSIVKVQKTARFVSDVGFPIPQDTGVQVFPAECQMVGIGSYQDHFLFSFFGLGRLEVHRTCLKLSLLPIRPHFGFMKVFIGFKEWLRPLNPPSWPNESSQSASVKTSGTPLFGLINFKTKFSLNRPPESLTTQCNT